MRQLGRKQSHLYSIVEYFQVEILGSWTLKKKKHTTVPLALGALTQIWSDTEKRRYTENSEGRKRKTLKRNTCRHILNMNLSWEVAARVVWMQWTGRERVSSVWEIRIEADSYSTLNKSWPNSGQSVTASNPFTHVLDLCRTAILRIISLLWQVTADKHSRTQ